MNAEEIQCSNNWLLDAHVVLCEVVRVYLIEMKIFSALYYCFLVTAFPNLVREELNCAVH